MKLETKMLNGKSYQFQLLVMIYILSNVIQSWSHQDNLLVIQPPRRETRTPVTKCKVRKEFTFMSIAERMRFVNAYKKISTKEPFLSRYKTLIMNHPQLASHIHNKDQFLPWHRLFLLNFEKLLGEVDPSVTLPYWDWSLAHQSPWRSSVLDIWSSLPWGLGGDGDNVTHCVTTGPFARDKWNIAMNDGRKSCLKRSFNGVPPGITTIHRALRFKPHQFTQFEDYIRNFIHDTLHWRIGGTMGDKYGSCAPEFILHHAFLDKIWADYQKQSPEHKWVYFKDTNYSLYRTTIPAKKMVDNDDLLGIKVCYRDPFESYSDTHRTLKHIDLNTIRSLMTKEAFPAPYFERYLKY